VGISQKIYGYAINEPMGIARGVFDQAQLQRPFKDRNMVCRIALYPKLASFRSPGGSITVSGPTI
jgi:hypothetical protein